MADLDSETTEVWRSLGQGPILPRFERSPAHLCLCCAAQRAVSGYDSLPLAAQRGAGWHLADSGLSRVRGRKTAHKARLLDGGSGGSACEPLGPRQGAGSKVEKTTVVKYKCVYYYTGPMLYNFTRTRICDLRLLHTEEKPANVPKLIRGPLKMVR